MRRFDRQLHLRREPVAIGVHVIGQYAENKGIEWEPKSNPNYDTQSFADRVKEQYLAVLQGSVHEYVDNKDDDRDREGTQRAPSQRAFILTHFSRARETITPDGFSGPLL
jgi:hypothetical protein